MFDRHYYKKNITYVYSLLSLYRKKITPRVLMYHSIGNGIISNDIWEIKYEKFVDHIQYLINTNRNFIGCPELFKKFNEKSVAITFDDGFRSVYEYAAPLLIQRKIPFTIFIATKYIKHRNDNYLSPEMLKELANENIVSIGSHGVSHDDLSKKSITQVFNELVYSKKYIEDLIGKEVNLFSYPHGGIFQNSTQILSDAGYSHAFTSKFGPVIETGNKLLIPRVEIWGNDTASELNKKMKGCWDWLSYTHLFKWK